MNSKKRCAKGSFFLQPKIFKYRADKRMSSTDYVVYSFLCGCRDNQTNQCFPSHGFIAEGTGVTRQTVSASISRLVALKLLKIVSPYDSRVGKSNTYEIILDHTEDEKSLSQRRPSVEEMQELSIKNFHTLMQKIKKVDNPDE